MTNFSASIPVPQMEAANAYLDDPEANGVASFGPDNFSVPVRQGTGGATHAGLHCWADPIFRAVLDAMTSDFPDLVITDGSGPPNFTAHCQGKSLEWSDPENWHEKPVMTGKERKHKGKTWTSLIDHNVWEPPVGWREVVSEGYPEWVQPTGAHDAYGIGDRVSFNGADYESLIAANVWSPTAYPAGWSAS